MIRFLIERPIAVFMAFTAFFILGIITYLNIPVSLLPDISIPEITVQISGKNFSARELENTLVAPIREQLMQVRMLKDLHSETRDGNAIIRLNFEYGANTDLVFIEVNEKIDAAMNYMPKETERPKVIKASASDIPVLNLNLTINDENRDDDEYSQKFMELSDFAETVIKRRIEQLPQVAMVDMTGVMNRQIVIIPDNNKLEINGMSLNDIENALNTNNLDAGNMIIRDGHYEYNIRFSSILRTIDDIRNIYIRKNDRIYQMKDLATINFASEKEKGIALFGDKRTVTLSIIKQSEENMANMQKTLNDVIDNLEKEYPQISFNISENQTELLDYTISNLKQNLILAFIFICLISMIFMKDIKSPLIIGFSMFISLVISLLFFYLCHISLNIVSLTGLILALGMMIDNSIIVTDNIGQFIQRGYSITDACIKGTEEIITPMLSSILTTISVFIPLIFLSGIAGAIFFDQAFSVTVGLLVSFITGIMFLPVLYKLVYNINFGKLEKWRRISKNNLSDMRSEKNMVIEQWYHAGVNWVFRHKILTAITMIIIFPIGYWLFIAIPKEKMPDIKQQEMIVYIEWNENIHIKENETRTREILQFLDTLTLTRSSFIGQQQFLLNRDRELTSTESEIYLKAKSYKELPKIRKKISDFITQQYPEAIVSYEPVGTVFEKIFSTGEPDLVVEYYTKNKFTSLNPETIQELNLNLYKLTGEKAENVPFIQQLNLCINHEKLLLYQVSYNDIYQTLKTAFKENQFATLRSHQQYLPIILGGKEKTIQEILDNELIEISKNIDGTRNKLSLSNFVTITPAQDLKTIVGGKSGEFIPMNFYHTDKAEEIISAAQKSNPNDMWEIDFSGSFFSNQKMIGEIMLILLISVLLMYFILAAQFESFLQPLIVLLEVPIDIAAAIGLLYISGHSLNLMSAIGLVVTSGIIINDSILKLDVMNQLRKEGMPLMEAIHEAGHRRLKAILMTSLTSIVCMAPLLFSHDMGSELEKPLAIATIGGMVIGTIISLLVIPVVYWRIYHKTENKISISGTR